MIRAEKIAKVIQKYYNEKIDVAIVLGSGLSGFIKELNVICEIPYSKTKVLPKPTVKGHEGKFVIGKIGGKTVLVLCGRFHLYEGNSALTCTLLILALKHLGVENLILTTSCGAINKTFEVGDIMLIKDQINLTGTSPLIELNKFTNENKFISMLNCYDVKYNERINKIAKLKNIKIKNGVFLQVLGPQYETNAEIEGYRKLGADAVSMSTGIETIMANYLGIKTVGFSCITNKTGKDATVLTHEEVLIHANKILSNFIVIIKEFIKDLK